MNWIPYIAGAGIGVLSWFAFLVSNKAIGCSTAYTRTFGMLESLISGNHVEENPYYQKFKPEIDWEWMLVLGIFFGSFATAIITGGFALSWVPGLFEEKFGYDPILRLIFALVGGILMGIGSRWAGGCTSGHGISGTLQLAVSGWIAVIVFFISGITAAMLLYGVIW
ncbi:hypothetical protein F1737_06535 [Methanoplanus sp. FWC-SCC4]|uniref:Sulphur transport domain-containing protein n=1 Tax=Methanochimaera problematica TaxID=2609417 RepID=A0AA97FC82_9EURY|nr:YeeE/YedE thiosulfate transporter family protein [Methanoplanus sp. FWC-SCC4]WOF16387.1 hypothetical protein F1737_06535 [Methanoplanus sp. FWC-SCC4]